MKKTLKLLGIILSVLISISTLAQTEAPTEKMSVPDRMAKARAARAEQQALKKTDKKRTTDARANANMADIRTTTSHRQSTQKTARTSLREKKASPADYKSPIDKSQKGPNGEVIHTGARGAKYYINKNGNKTYLSSNQ